MPLALLLLTAAAPPDYDALTAAAVARLGGKAEADPALPAEARVVARFETLTDAALGKLCKYPQLGAIEAVDAGKCTEKGFADLRELPALRRLVLGKATASDKALAEIGRMRSLEVLYLGESKVTDAGLAHLKKLADLKVLDLYDTRVTDKGVAHLKALPGLEELNLSGTKVTDAGLAGLKGMSKLKVLKLNRTAVTPKGVSDLEAALPKLTVRQ